MKSCPPPRARLALSGLLRALAAAWLICGFAAVARADLRLCNLTQSRVSVAFGYRDAQGWATEGWWNLKPNDCDILLKGPLAARFYYIFASDTDRGGEWSGQAYLCTRDKEFTIRGIENCLARGYDRTGFFEIDTGEQKSWTVQLTDASRPAPR